MRVLPVSDDHQEYAEGVVERLVDQRFRAELARPATPWARIRRAKLEKVPYVLVVGEDDVGPARSGSTRAQEVERDVPLDDFIERLATDVAERR